MIIVELNEFSTSLLKAISGKLQLETISRILEFRHCETVSVESKERFGLDPWVQWVSIHTGKTREQHGIAHLAEAHLLEAPQIWDTLATREIKYGVWGCMNAKYTPSRYCDFFIADPWTYTEPTKPDNLRHFLSLARYYAKNYLTLSPFKLMIHGIQSLIFLIRQIPTLISLIPVLIRNTAVFRKPNIALFVYFDLVNAALFTKYRKKNNTEFNIVFFNSLAHYQHNDWPDTNALKKSDIAFFQVLEAAIKLSLASATHEEPIAVINAFSQIDSSKKGEILYRQKDPRSFFEQIGLEDFRLEQLMTNDSQLIFSNESDKLAAAKAISSITIESRPAFDIDTKPEQPTSLFCQFILWEKLSEGTTLVLPDGRTLPFHQHFEQLAVRTGEHIPKGDIFYHAIDFPKTTYNHEIHDCILNHYKEKQ